MSVQRYDPSHPIQVTAAAYQHFLERLSQKPDTKGIRVSVKNSGCSGYKYDVAFVSESQNNDTIIPLDDNYQLYIDPKALPLITGSHIELVKEGLNESIEFKNPNVDATCGCGESFSLKT